MPRKTGILNLLSFLMLLKQRDIIQILFNKNRPQLPNVANLFNDFSVVLHSKYLFVVFNIIKLALTLRRLLFLEDALERDNFMSPEEAKSFGVIDHVLSNQPLPSENENS